MNRDNENNTKEQQLQEALTSCAFDPNVGMADIRKVFESIIDLYDLDVAFAMTNKEYKYQLRYIVLCEKPDNKILRHDNIDMTISQYNMLVKYYKEHPYYERVLTKEINGCEAYMLQCPVMRDDEYYGTVSFGSSKPRVWTGEEKGLIKKVSQLILVYIGLDRLKDQEFNELSRSLEIERERALNAELQAMIDPLTGAYNRAGFDRTIKQYRKENEPVGFVLFDIDNFKTINDTYGHEFGDEVLDMVAKRLMSSFRNEDKVFRLGGDEFGLILSGCKSDAWRSLQMKFSNLHHYLKESIDRDVSVTMSAGFCQADNGYSDEMFSLADEALYHTKSTGRAGLTQINMNHEIIYTWHDTEIADPSDTKAKAVALGNWRVEGRKDESQTPRLFLDETSHIMMEIPNTLSPEECYEFWKERVVQRHMELLQEVVGRLKTTGQAECTYHWNHPTKGEIELRAVGQCRDSGSMLEFYGYMRETKKSEIVLSQDDGQFLMEALNRIYFCTYYFDLKTYDYFIVKGHENEPDVKALHHNIDVTFKLFAEKFVHPDFRDKIEEFADLTTLADRIKDKTYIDCEYLSVSKLGWCRTVIMPVKWDAGGNVTHAVSMSASIDESKRAELQKEKEINDALQFQLRIGDIISRTRIAQTAMNLGDTSDAINYLLDQIIQHYDCRRACLSRLSGEHQGTIITERCNTGETRKFADGQVLTLANFMEWESVYSPIKLKRIFCPGDESPAQKWMKDESIDNLMILSFEYGTDQIGYISIDGVRQHKDETDWIGTIAYFISNELAKQSEQ